MCVEIKKQLSLFIINYKLSIADFCFTQSGIESCRVIALRCPSARAAKPTLQLSLLMTPPT